MALQTTFTKSASDTRTVLPDIAVHGICVLDDQSRASSNISQSKTPLTNTPEKPKIALVMSRLTDVIPTGETTGYFVPQDYISAITQAGGDIMLVDYDTDPEEVANSCDGLLVIGGFSPFPEEWYAKNQSSPYSEAKDSIDSTDRGRAEARLMDAFHKANQPILGICNGMQTMAAHFGEAKLTGNIHEHNPDGITHCGAEIRHDVIIEQETRLAQITGLTEMTVNSRHNEAVIEIPKNSTLKISAKAPDGAIEAVELTDHPFAIGVQFHPENLAIRDNSAPAKKIFSSFIDEAKNHMAPIAP